MFLVFKNGEKIDELEGAMKSGLIELLDRAQQAWSIYTMMIYSLK